MSSRWRRLGQLMLDASPAPWARSHAALPIVEALGGGEWRVYMSARDADGRSRIARTTLRLEPQPALGPLEPEPVLDLGPLGAFDDSGVTSSCLVADGDRRYLYYTGWSRGVTVPFYLAAGVAVSTRSGPFARLSHAPLLDRNAIDPYLTASPWVIREDGTWRMWYVSATGWTQEPSGPRHRYHIRYAESDDGLAWDRRGHVCLDYESPSEYAFSRPCVVAGATYEMWFAVRGDRYRVGYATSRDGVVWSRDDETGGLMPSGRGWDSNAAAYPCIFEAHGDRYMLYNGNEYGRTGVGLAVWDGEARGDR